MPRTIFDLVTATELVSYWEELNKDRAPYLGETLFPNQKKLGLDLSWLKGSKGLPVVLKLSAFDAQAVPRTRIGFEKLSAEMPFFKESLYVDEQLRQELNKVLESGNQAYIDAIMNRIFDDNTTLIEAAEVARERMRMMLLTTGVITMASNGQAYTYDYGIPLTHKPTVNASWATTTTDIVSDIRGWQDMIEDETGVRPTRSLVSRKTWGYFLANQNIRNAVLGNNSGAAVSDAQVTTYLMNTLGLSVAVYSKRYKNESGVSTKYVPDDIFSLFPEGTLGNTWFGTTPEESDLMASSAVDNVAIVDTGVAVTTMRRADPVNVETKVTQISLPSFEAADQLVIADIIP
jgi:hypothetical protein